jgi:phage FluMu gp28-like protein
VIKAAIDGARRCIQSDYGRSALIPLAPFQKDWILDKARCKICVKSRRIGMTYAATLEIVLDSLERPRSHWMIISCTQDTSKEALQECAYHLDRMNLLRRAKMISERTGMLLDGVEQSKFSLLLPNGSKIIAMTAHPDTTRGFGGNILLDEHGFHAESQELWKAAVGSTLRGHRLIVISTPNYQVGNYYRLAAQAGLALGYSPGPNPVKSGIWSAHWIDIHMAIPQLAAIGIDIDPGRIAGISGPR